MTSSTPSASSATDGSQRSLERRYRRLLRLFPEPRRTEIGEELLGVLLDAAAPGQRRPTPGEALSLCRSALSQRLRQTGAALRSPTWSDALAVLTVLLPAALAVRALRPALMLTRWYELQLPTSLWPAWSSAFLAGWLAPTVWLLVIGLVLVPRPRLAGLAAIVATAIDGIHILEVAHAPSVWLAQGLIPYLAVEVLATVLLLGHRRVARGVALVSRRGLVGALIGLALVYASSLSVFSSPQPFGVDVLALGGLAVLAGVAWIRRSALAGAAGVRVALMALAVFWSTQLVGGHVHRTTSLTSITGWMLLYELVLCLLVPLIMMVVAFVATALGRRAVGRWSSAAVARSA